MNTSLEVGESLYASLIRAVSVSFQKQELRCGEVVTSTASEPWWLGQDSSQVTPTPGSFQIIIPATIHVL